MGNFTSLLSDIGNGLGAFLNAIVEPLMYFMLAIAVIGGITVMFNGIFKRISK